jgi:hypothetical protein
VQEIAHGGSWGFAVVSWPWGPLGVLDFQDTERCPWAFFAGGSESLSRAIAERNLSRGGVVSELAEKLVDGLGAGALCCYQQGEGHGEKEAGEAVRLVW